MPDKRVSQVNKKGITTNLKALFAEADELLKDKLDSLLLILRKDEPELYTGYSKARIIIDLKGRGKNKEEIEEENKDITN